MSFDRRPDGLWGVSVEAGGLAALREGLDGPLQLTDILDIGEVIPVVDDDLLQW
ncbi:hypothetical protein D9M70_542070 [compost metagenome]